MSSEPIFLNTLEIPMRWVDMDAYGHANSARYFDYMCEARCILLGSLMQQNLCQFVVVETNCRYRRPYVYPDTIIVKQYCHSYSASSFDLSYRFHSISQPDTLFAEGMAKMVCYDPNKKTITRVPEALLKVLLATV